MKRISLNNILMATLLLLFSTMFAPVSAWPEVDTMNMCNQPVQVIRAYSGSDKGWVNRDYYIAKQKRRIYAANCPQVKSTKKTAKKKVYRKVTRKNRRLKKSCSDCYKKGYQDGYREKVVRNKRNQRVSNRKRKAKRSGYRNHAEEIADCKRVDLANNASRTKVIAAW